MARTRRLHLPLLASAQAQKHVTVNEALVRVDALAAPVVLSRSSSEPPTSASDGDMYVVAPDATGDWEGEGGNFALFDNGGWLFCLPHAGKRAWVVDERREIVHDGDGWVEALGAAAFGAGAALCVSAIDHVVTSGASSTTTDFIPDKAIVLGVTGRVIAPLVGPGLTTWRLGVSASADRYGSGLGTALNSFVEGVTSGPLTYFGATALVLRAEAGAFSGGVVRLCAHYLKLSPPRTV